MKIDNAKVEIIALVSLHNTFEMLLELLEAEQPVILDVKNKELYEIISIASATNKALINHFKEKYN